ncbi:MAG: hypothetical protein P4L27_07365 [Ignavibacteriaceae bacterium]|nr:hypothetical protein [Ignavibacteriaceae bacterium]
MVPPLTIIVPPPRSVAIAAELDPAVLIITLFNVRVAALVASTPCPRLPEQVKDL